MKSSIKLFGTALLFGAAFITAAAAHDTRGSALINLTAAIAPVTAPHSTSLIGVTANVGNLVNTDVQLGGGQEHHGVGSW